MKSPIKPAGSLAGRGFRYQDAVGALLVVQGWTGASAFGAVTPEAHDDFDLGVRSTDGRRLDEVIRPKDLA